MKQTFYNIYKNNLWGSSESISGPGSELNQTINIRLEIPELIKKFKIKSILDLPCGDYNWMKEINIYGCSYIGADIVDEIIDKNKIKFPNIDFRNLDLANDDLPKSDLIITRDCFGHLSFKNTLQSLKNLKRSCSKYLLSTCWPRISQNTDIIDGDWYPINMMMSPFNLIPIYMICENLYYTDKSLFLFEIDKINL
jgi:SAM-dependent methyltransferase